MRVKKISLIKSIDTWKIGLWKRCSVALTIREMTVESVLRWGVKTHLVERIKHGPGFAQLEKLSLLQIHQMSILRFRSQTFGFWSSILPLSLERPRRNMARRSGPLSPMWEISIACLTPGFSLLQHWFIMAIYEWTRNWKLSFL